MKQSIRVIQVFAEFTYWGRKMRNDTCKQNRVIDVLTSCLLEEASKRTVQEAIAGDRFCAVTLDDGTTGLANVCPEVCGQPSSIYDYTHAMPGSAVSNSLMSLRGCSPSAAGLAALNGLTNRAESYGRAEEDICQRGDLLDVLELQSADHVGMVGCFYPLVGPIEKRVAKLSIFERGSRLSDDLLSEEDAYSVLPKCSVALITATTVLNGTIDDLLAVCAGCREVVLLGPSTPLAPAVFSSLPYRVTLLSGVLVTDRERLFEAIAAGGGTRDFKGSIEKVNVPVPASV